MASQRELDRAAQSRRQNLKRERTKKAWDSFLSKTRHLPTDSPAYRKANRQLDHELQQIERSSA